MGAGPVVAVRFCPRCGAGADADARFCASCGADLSAFRGSAIAQPEPPAPPQPAHVGGIVGPVAGPVVPAGRMPDAGPASGSSAIGRRASPLGWIGVVLTAGGFLAASLGVIVLAGQDSGSQDRPGGSGTPATGFPAARFDEMLRDGSTVTEGEPFEIEVEAVNPAGAATDRLWLVIDWRPSDLPATPGARGSFRACDPAACAVREVPDGSRTVISWPGLPPGGRQVLRVTVAASGLEPGGDLWYRVRTGSGPSETALDGTSVWDLTLEVE